MGYSHRMGYSYRMGYRLYIEWDIAIEWDIGYRMNGIVRLFVVLMRSHMIMITLI